MTPLNVMVPYVTQQVVTFAHLIEKAQVPAGSRIPEVSTPFAGLEAWIVRIQDQLPQRIVHLPLLVRSEFGVCTYKSCCPPDLHKPLPAGCLVQVRDQVLDVAEPAHPVRAHVSLRFQQAHDLL